jgi:hypothetical protein
MQAAVAAEGGLQLVDLWIRSAGEPVSNDAYNANA